VPKKRNKVGSLPVIEPNAAGIDVGATEIFVRFLQPVTRSQFGVSQRLPSI